MKVLNVRSLILSVLVAGLAFSSCKKSNDAAPKPTIEGTWVGAYGIGNNPPTKYFSFIINGDGTLKAKSDDPNKEYNGTGTWKMTDGTFTAVYQYQGLFFKFNVAAKVDIEAGTMNGSHGSGEENPSAGDFFMNRQ